MENPNNMNAAIRALHMIEDDKSISAQDKMTQAKIIARQCSILLKTLNNAKVGSAASMIHSATVKLDYLQLGE